MAADQQDPASATHSDGDLGFLLMETARVFRQSIERAVIDNPFGLTPSAIRALGCVIRFQGDGLNVIAKRMDIEPMSLHNQIDRLEQCGLVERRDCSSDRRKKPIFPTQKAIEVMAGLDPAFDQLYRTMTRDVPRESMEQLTAILVKMRANLTADPGITAPFTLLPKEPAAT
ncbi:MULTISPECIES: MarR family winged helix-turn-helix transcriptional regulator [unclassified Aureimonas]|uniref:MarR family winged helix-turn-helix transcriptional regulator n=1 Tax=unclassified Aureimonas TaxID=2615206 RepID=UPI00071F4BB7|nr:MULTISPECIES: MarR family transcriptional regulator [unclassified Aureimonas]ALN75600.1 hypothetical protein M673_22920 [Aureimonas sp. AU20]